MVPSTHPSGYFFNQTSPPPPPPPILKYVLYPGVVRSRVDGDVHFISASRLASLYGVDMRACLAVEPTSMSTERCVATQALASALGLTPLYPNYFGNYALPQPKDPS